MVRDALWHSVYEHVAAHAPSDDIEVDAQKQILAAMERLPFPLAEEGDRVHLTGSGMVVGPRGVVLHLHKRMGIWLQPGGHIDPGESPWDAAVRETLEETGLVAAHPDAGPKLVHVDVHDAPKDHVHLDLRYLLHAPDEDPAPPPGESPDAKWFSWYDAMDVENESLRRALRAARIA